GQTARALGVLERSSRGTRRQEGVFQRPYRGSATIQRAKPTLTPRSAQSSRLGEKKMRVNRALLCAVGVIGFVATASATPPPWSNARHHHPAPAHAEYTYARVVDVDPIVRQVRVETPRRECWD